MEVNLQWWGEETCSYQNNSVWGQRLIHVLNTGSKLNYTFTMTVMGSCCFHCCGCHCWVFNRLHVATIAWISSQCSYHQLIRLIPDRQYNDLSADPYNSTHNENIFCHVGVALVFLTNKHTIYSYYKKMLDKAPKYDYFGHTCTSAPFIGSLVL